MASFLNFTRDKQVNKVVEVEVNQIIPNPHQPRTEFEDTDIRALAESIAQNGILQPISIRRNGDIYELIAGERRLFRRLTGGICLGSVYRLADRWRAVERELGVHCVRRSR